MRFLNKTETPQKKKFHTVKIKVAGMVGPKGPYTLTVNKTDREKEIEGSPHFVTWLTSWMILDFESET